MSQKIAVVGLGAIGSMAIWRLAKRGVSVTGFDQYAPANNRGASSGETRLFRAAYAEGSVYTPLLVESIDLWKELQNASGRTVFHHNGALTVGRQDHDEIQMLLANTEAAGMSLEMLDEEEMSARFPQHRLLEGEVGLLDPLGGLLRPEAAVISAVSEAAKLGATIRTGTRVVAVKEGPQGVAVTTESGTEVYDKVLVAPGPWAPILLPELKPHIQPERVVSIWFPAEQPELFGPERFLPTLRRGNGLDLTAFPSVDGNLVKVNLHLPRTLVDDVETRDREIENAYVEATREAVRRGFNGLSDLAVRREAYVEGYTPDEDPIVGPISPEKRIIAMTGFSGHGFKFSPAMGEVAADLVINETTDRPIAHMAPNRALVSN
ncbi:sarcosine oxidase [Paenarthrobacter nitroguajacolicus]|uniref:N-methyl-L-tryptophan oxidase n=1 Tax=Paenarthrobacter nitroguajacolicus TaxID=211146 RepID=UPI0028618C71|nr:N-methyl-L-tryptophan oxidase [Paenarthrobacter nitroguajacolicus]MDR6989285.1 sarcosine oxidase [Paenarthrobacter nitroguajacolicus]